MEFYPGVMQRLNATYQGAIMGLNGLSLTAFDSSSKLFGQRHCCGELIDRRAWGMGAYSAGVSSTASPSNSLIIAAMARICLPGFV